MQPLEFFAGVDWSSKEHQVCVLDLEGKVCGQRGFAHCGKGLHEMIDWIVNTTGAPAEKVGVVIETPRGPVVESLLGRGFVVHSINPKQMDRYRDRFSVAGAKDDRLDARVLAETARLDRSHLRTVDAQMPEVVQLRHCSRLCAQLNEDKVRLSNQLHQILWSYYPQFLELRVDLARTWVLELMMMAPTPQKAKRMHVSTIEKLLRKHRIRSQDAETIKRCLSNTSVSVAEGVTEGAVFQLNSVVNRLRLATEELKRTYDEMDRLIEAYDEALGERARKADGDSEAMQWQRDVEILSSLPGVGRIVLATLLAEAADLLQLRDYIALRAFGGTAPVTRRSGKMHRVVRRRAVNHRLQYAIYHWARIAVQHDQSAKTNTPLCVPGATATQGRCAASLTDSSKWLARCSQTNRFLIKITQDMNSPHSIQLKLDCGVIAPQKLLTNGRKSFNYLCEVLNSTHSAPVPLDAYFQLELHVEHTISIQTSF